jgi:hypothetical protein
VKDAWMTKAVRIDEGDLVQRPVSVRMASVDHTEARNGILGCFGRVRCITI